MIRDRVRSMVSISQAPGVTYPRDRAFSPDSSFPEYPFDGGALSARNDVYRLVRRCLAEAGCDHEHFDTATWNPLGTWIRPGDRVFVLPNFLTHKRPLRTWNQFRAKVTHASVIRAVLDYAVVATGDPSLVSFGNAPVQNCDHPRVVRQTGARTLGEFYRKQGNSDPGPHDLRFVKSRFSLSGALLDRTYGDPDDVVLVPLDEHSLLEPLFADVPSAPHVRAGGYAPGDTTSFHDVGRHVYAVHRRLLEADVIISVPKLKTHQKVGITCAVKGTVGTIARKECLAHYRRGAACRGGDEYPGRTVFHELATRLTDLGASGGRGLGHNLARMAGKGVTETLRAIPGQIVGGNWPGNDTTWRMAVDIARILRHADRHGTLKESPVRQHLSLVDGIIAGEGRGPYLPRPRKLGVVLFGADICAADLACALVMGFDPRKIPIVDSGFSPMPYGLTESSREGVELSLNGKPVAPHELAAHFRPAFRIHGGWEDVIRAKPGDLERW